MIPIEIKSLFLAFLVFIAFGTALTVYAARTNMDWDLIQSENAYCANNPCS